MLSETDSVLNFYNICRRRHHFFDVTVSKMTKIEKKNTVGRLIKATTEVSEKGENLAKPQEKKKTDRKINK